MKAQDVRQMTEDQISDEVARLKKEQFNLRFQRAGSRLTDTGCVKRRANDLAPESARFIYQGY